MDLSTEALPIASLPPLGEPLSGGTFVGMTVAAGHPCAVVRLPELPEPRLLTQGRAKAWALRAGGELPSRAVMLMMALTDPENCRAKSYWTAESASAGWGWATGRGEQHDRADLMTMRAPANAEYTALAVRLVRLVGAAEVDSLPARIAALEARFTVGLADRVRALEALGAQAA